MSTNTKQLSARSDLHILRKIWHILCGVSVLSAYYLSNQEIVIYGWFCVSVALFGFTIDLLRMKFDSMNQMTVKVLGPLMRKSEENGFSGLPFYALGAGLSIFFFEKHIALISIMFLVFADPIASFVGVNMGRDKILPNKSLQGTIASFFVCYLVSFIYLLEYGVDGFNLILFSVLAGIIGAISELASAFNIDDNLTIPVISGAGLTVLNYFFQIF
jgi:diacylglycerol kinase (CTP)